MSRRALIVVLAALLLAASATTAVAKRPSRDARTASAHVSRHTQKKHKKSEAAKKGKKKKKSKRKTPRQHARSVPAPSTTASGPTVPAVPAPPPVSATCPGDTDTPTASNVAEIETATICLINQQRAAAGLVTLSTNSPLTLAAQLHDQDMITDDYFAHDSLNGTTFLQRLQQVGYVQSDLGYAVGENLAWATLYLATPAEIVDAWMNSPDHRANILNPNYVQTGMAVIATVPSSLSGGEAGATYDEEFGVLLAPE
ncbi:MAG TPA: CAP domain-containing protein [Solirubrobacteraceae bacterium]|nr:CAP domain-containing protein [Solirubrobacteraceae bacterium]